MVEYVRWEVTRFYDLAQDERFSTSNELRFVGPRKVGYYLSKTLTDYSYLQIGRKFGRDHTTILSGARTIAWAIGDKSLGKPEGCTWEEVLSSPPDRELIDEITMLKCMILGDIESETQPPA